MTQVNLKKLKSKSILMLFLEINLWFSKIDEILAQMSSIFFHLTLNLDIRFFYLFFIFCLSDSDSDSDSTVVTRNSDSDSI